MNTAYHLQTLTITAYGQAEPSQPDRRIICNPLFHAYHLTASPEAIGKHALAKILETTPHYAHVLNRNALITHRENQHSLLLGMLLLSAHRPVIRRRPAKRRTSLQKDHLRSLMKPAAH